MVEPRPPLPTPRRWWHDWRWIAAVAALLLGLAASTVAVKTTITDSRVGDQAEVIDRLGTLAESNAAAIRQIEHNQAGIDELVAFVRDIQQQDTADDHTVQTFIDLLCASSDPVRLAACAELVS